MHNDKTSQSNTRSEAFSAFESSFEAESNVIELLLKEAKKLHKSLKSESISVFLPVLRRLIATKTLKNIGLPELCRNKAMVQRKHILQMLAYEMAYDSWAQCRKALSRAQSDQQVHYCLALRRSGYPNHWFSSMHDAELYTREHGGKPVLVGSQAVVVPKK
ncbi:hypothetical protein [Agaribacterium sp. ZY112]|uniref:hypothetical protein n=1 Tax=Agaribacterium sp. ZY112 TaxID=3233574 RepID=UPI003525B10A